jgi:hypothetical protein
MKATGICPKCGSREVLRIPGATGAYGRKARRARRPGIVSISRITQRAGLGSLPWRQGSTGSSALEGRGLGGGLHAGRDLGCAAGGRLERALLAMEDLLWRVKRSRAPCSAICASKFANTFATDSCELTIFSLTPASSAARHTLQRASGPSRLGRESSRRESTPGRRRPSSAVVPWANSSRSAPRWRTKAYVATDNLKLR